MEKKEKIKKFFEKIKEAHKYYVSGDNDYRIRLSNALEPIFKNLETLGVERSFSETLLISGKEFVDSLIEPHDGPATIEDVEIIFEGKVTDQDERTKREVAIAEKHGITAWRSIPGDTVRIESLDSKAK